MNSSVVSGESGDEMTGNTAGASIGFIGVGAIGRPMAERMLSQFALTICDTNEEARAHFADRAPTCSSASELADRSEIVFACLPTHDSYRAVIRGTDSLLDGKAIRVLVQVGTTGPDIAREMAADCAAAGVQLLDCPVTGGPHKALEGTLAAIVSGDPGAFERAEPLIRTFAADVIYLGHDAGQAQIMKLINNILSATNLAASCEALVLGVKAGLDPAAMLQVLNVGTGQNSATLSKIPDHILKRTFDYGGRLEVVHKDLASFVNQARLLGLSVPFADLVESTYSEAMNTEGEGADMTRIIRPMERAAGVEFGTEG